MGEPYGDLRSWHYASGYWGSKALLHCMHCRRNAPLSHKTWWLRTPVLLVCADKDSCEAMQSVIMLEKTW